MTNTAKSRTVVEISPTEPVGTITCELNAPRDLVWRAMSEPEHLVAWWGPRGYTNTVTAYDFRVGGRWQIRTDIPNGPTVVFQGEFREIVAPEKIVRTFGMEGMWEGRYAVETVTLIADGPRTIYRGTSRFASRADFEGMIASGMEKGMNEGFERLDELLAELPRQHA